MLRWSVVVLALGLLRGAALAAPPEPVICFGNEPSWSLTIATPDKAKLSAPDAAPTDYAGATTEIAALHERVWRGAPAGGGGTLVAFIRQAKCSDGMSDVIHPYSARVSLPSGKALVGCCRVLVTTDASAAAIEGRGWQLAHLQGQPDSALAALKSPVTVRFVAGRLQGFGGCNRLTGAYELQGDQVKLEAIASTMMMCEPAIMTVENAFRKTMTGALRVAIADDRLSLTPLESNQPALVFTAAPLPRLDGIAWKVTGYNNGRQAVVSPLKGTSLTLTFKDGTVSGNAGCNSFRAPYTLDGDTLTIGPAVATRKACPGKGVMQQEQEFLAALATTSRWAIDRGMLDLHRPDGERVLTANPS
ncbi:MAG: META domain-containing protein [Deltaproteobacteria bacterium]|nr:META domain-containing protein [Deltaproteobacteria bacterium]